jgi:hypothetical protein
MRTSISSGKWWQQLIRHGRTLRLRGVCLCLESLPDH